MARLQIDLQDGFDNDTVVIRVNGRQVYEKDSVSTRTQIGFADSVKTDVPGGQSTIEVTVRNRNAVSSFSVPTDSETKIGISLDNHEIKHRVLPKNFGYA